MLRNLHLKKFSRSSFKIILSLKVLAEIFLNFLLIYKKSNYIMPKLYYASAKRSDIGGPYIKIKKLDNFFPEHKFKFNIVYLLSNKPYINSLSINLIKKKKVLLVLNQNGVFYPSWYKGDWKKENLIMSKIYHASDYVLWQSKFCKKASDYFLGKRYGKGEILYNAVDTKKFSPKKNNVGNIFKLLITGNFRKQNNYRIQIVLESIKEIIKVNNYIHLYIAGYIEDKAFFLVEIERLNIKNYVTFLGKYSQKDAPLIYQKADLYITMSYQDNCPSAVLEAMSCGLPVLYSSTGGTPELVGINSGIGLEVPHDWKKIFVPSKESVVQGILKIFDERNFMSESARERAVKMFDINEWYKRHQEIFEKLLGER